MNIKLDIDKILNNPKVQELMLENKKLQKKVKIVWYILLILTIILTILSTIKDGIKSFTMFLIFYSVIFWIIIYFYNKRKTNKILENNKKVKLIIKNTLNTTNSNFKFSLTKKLFPITLSNFSKKSWLLKPYQWINFEEDSIKFSQDWFNLYWEEVETYTLKINKDWNEYKEIVDHIYIFYIEILNHRFPIKEKVFVKPNFLWENSKNIENVIGNIVEANYINLLDNVINLWKSTNDYLKNKVKLENQAFEENFDVYSKDEIETRRLLTPKMMEKLIELIKKSKMKWWAFTFENDKIYVKFELSSKFLEVSSIDKNGIKNFLTEINTILDFVNYLNIEYFSQNEFSKDT